jgi:hypothetical protein
MVRRRPIRKEDRTHDTSCQNAFGTCRSTLVHKARPHRRAASARQEREPEGGAESFSGTRRSRRPARSTPIGMTISSPNPYSTLARTNGTAGDLVVARREYKLRAGLYSSPCRESRAQGFLRKWRRRESNPRPQPHRMSVYKHRRHLDLTRRPECHRPTDEPALLRCRASGEWLSFGA